MDTQVLEAISFIVGIVLTTAVLFILDIVLDKREERKKKLNKN